MGFVTTEGEVAVGVAVFFVVGFGVGVGELPVPTLRSELPSWPSQPR